MPRKSSIPLEKATLYFFKGDLTKLQETYPNVPKTTMVRHLIHKHLEAVKAAGGEAPRIEVEI